MSRLKSVVPVAALATLLLSPQLASAKSNAKKSRIYDGKGLRLTRQETLQFRFKISKDGRRVTHLFVDFAARCGRKDSFGPDVRYHISPPVQRDGSFTATISTFAIQRHGEPPTGKLILSGRFVSAQLASGTARFTGRGQAHGCKMSRRWKAKLRPLLDRYVGTTSAGTKASFYRTIEQHPKVANFNFGTISARCADGSYDQVTTTDLPPAPVRNKRFTTKRAAGGDSSSVSGTFSSATAASGTIALKTSIQVGFGPFEDCTFSGTWTVHRGSHGLIGPMNFPSQGS